MKKKIYLILELEVNEVHDYRYYPHCQGKALLHAMDYTTMDGAGMLNRWKVKCIASLQEGKKPEYINEYPPDELQAVKKML